MDRSSTTRVLSVCSLSHADVWKLTSRLLPEFVKADKYVVYVPDNEVDTFLSITDSSIEVLPQSILGVAFATKLQQAMDLTDNIKRYGWYLQQFLKIEALLQSSADWLVIWDADCVPVKKIELFDDNGRAIYMRASEYHQEYFSMIERLLGLSRIQNQSFVIPGFPFKGAWAKDFIRDIESQNDEMKWFDAIISCTDLSQRSGFSETETLGTWIANIHPDSWTTSDLAWERLGQSRFGFAKNHSTESLITIGRNKNLDIISFENWDRRSVRKTLRSVKDSFFRL
jgi:hypothetical protein